MLYHGMPTQKYDGEMNGVMFVGVMCYELLTLSIVAGPRCYRNNTPSSRVCGIRGG